MKRKKVSIIVLLLFILLFVGCGGNTSPESTWDKYIKAMNNKSLEEVAEIYYVKDSTSYNRFLEGKTASEYFPFTKITTNKFEPTLVNINYYAAHINVLVDDSSKDFNVYFVKNIAGEWDFISEVNVTSSDQTLLGNQPNNNYYNNIVKIGEGFEYKYVYGDIPGVVSDKDYVKIVGSTTSEKRIVIPEKIEGAPVKIIGDFAFYEATNIFSSISIPKSKLEEIVIPQTVTTIEQYAFYQAKNLKSVVLPEDLTLVKNYAFAGCTNLESITVYSDEKSMYDPSNIVSLESTDSMKILGNKIIPVSDKPVTYQTFANAPVKWSVNDTNIATINETTGALTAIAEGTVTIKATNKADATLFTTTQVNVKPMAVSIAANPDLSFSIAPVLYVGDTLSLTTTQAAKWTVNDSNIATITEAGKLLTINSGTVTITATSDIDENDKATVTIEVKPLSEKNVETTYSYEPIKFDGARNLYVGDYVKLITEDYELYDVLWSQDNGQVASIDMYEGLVKALTSGIVTITVTLRENPNINSSVKINVIQVEPSITFSENSLDRLTNLKTFYVNAINPNSVIFKGNLKLNSEVIIYVPSQNYESYLASWNEYAQQIKKMD